MTVLESFAHSSLRRVLLILSALVITSCGAQVSNALPQASIPIPENDGGEITIGTPSNDLVEITATSDTFPADSTVVLQVEDDLLDDVEIISADESEIDLSESQLQCEMDLPECPEINDQGLCRDISTSDGGLETSIYAQVGQYVSMYYMEDGCTAVETLKIQIMETDSKVNANPYKVDTVVPVERKKIYTPESGFISKQTPKMVKGVQLPAPTVASSMLQNTTTQNSQTTNTHPNFHVRIAHTQDGNTIMRFLNSNDALISDKLVMIAGEPLKNAQLFFVEPVMDNSQPPALGVFLVRPQHKDAETGVDEIFIVPSVRPDTSGPLNGSKLTLSNIGETTSPVGPNETLRILSMNRFYKNLIFVTGRFSPGHPVEYETHMIDGNMQDGTLHMLDSNINYQGSVNININWLVVTDAQGLLWPRLRFIDNETQTVVEINPDNLETEMIHPINMIP